ncbi:hypothetical protein KBI5_14780 [Frankia sp. KB5]|nr:helix-turn-helix domain-containing protein [Frankia sp. KB5]ORT49012.1 hypothetical protein KBI5_14780 [Frankia sp. KB5]
MADISEAAGGPDRPSRLWGTGELSDFLGVSKSTIYKWRAERKGPPGVRIGKYIKWREEDVHRWFEEHRDDF